MGASAVRTVAHARFDLLDFESPYAESMSSALPTGNPTATHWRALSTQWEGRSGLAADWLRNATAVADVGCGLMTLERLLPEGTGYIPMDVVRRDARTIVFDFNKEPIPTVPCDALVLLGVLEYSNDIASVVAQFTRFPRVLFSYNHVSVNDVLWTLRLRPKRVTWKNRHTRGSLRSILVDAGLRISREGRVRLGERLYDVRPA